MARRRWIWERDRGGGKGRDRGACPIASWEVETRGLQVQGLPGLYSESEASLDNLVKPCVKLKQGLGV